MSSCKVKKKADPYQEQKTKFLQRVSDFWLDHGNGFPSPSDVASWNVYVLSNGWFKHYSLMFEFEDTGKAFTIELVKDEIDNEHYEVGIYFRVINISKYR